MNNVRIVIIGGGIGGLATAALLGKQGYSVTLVEKNKDLGGRARVFSHKGFRFDMGPSWYLMPDVFNRFYKYFGKKPTDFYKLKRLDPHYRIFFNDKDTVDMVDDLKKNLSYFESLEKGSAEKIKKYLSISEYQYRTAMSGFVYRTFDRITDMFQRKLLFEGSKLHVFENMDSYLRRFTHSDRIKKILLYTIVFLGGSPKNTPAIYSLLSYIDFVQGVFYPIGGISKIVSSLESLCLANGVTIIKNSPVDKIVVESGGIATAVVVKKKQIAADVVISNADLPFTELHLLPKQFQTYPQSYWQKKIIAPSTFLMYLGIKGKVTSLTHHNLLFSDDWVKHFEEIFKNPSWPKHPSMYICAPSKSDSTVSPTNYENLFVLVPVAANLRDSDSMREKYSNYIISEIEKIIGEKIRDKIVYKRIFTQRDYIKDYNAYKGTALGLSHTLFQSAAFRPGLQSKKVKNLFYVGQYTQPGIGMPMCLISAELVTQKVIDYAKRFR